jgi:hypothetical protein
MKPILFLSILMFSFVSVFAQGSVHPKVQAEIDALNLWLQQQMSDGNSLDMDELQRKNEYIKQLQQKLSNENDTVRVNEQGIEGDKSRIQGFPGSSYKVPEGVHWYVANIYIKQLDSSYRIKVAEYVLNKVYKSGETITFPSWTAEFSLLDSEGDISSLFFEVELIEVSND